MIQVCRDWGLDENETKYLIQNKYKLLKFSKLVLVMSHLACADNPKSELNKKQLLKFLNLRKHFPTVPLSLSNSAGILLGKKYHFDMVRPGISLYGGHCGLNERKIYHNVVTLKSKLIQVREIKKNDSIGYGATYKAKTKMKIGTLSLGYADGINRLFSNNLNIHYKSKKIKVVGRISMDLITLDLSNISKNEKLDKIILDIISDNNSINKISKLINTIPYEILTNLGKGITEDISLIDGKTIFRNIKKIFKSNIFFFIIILSFFFYNIKDFQLDASSDTLILDQDEDLKKYREVVNDYGTNDFLIVTFTAKNKILEKNNLSIIKSFIGTINGLPRYKMFNLFLMLLCYKLTIRH